MQEFYQQLDGYYAKGDLKAVETFLLEHAKEDRDGPTQLAACNELGSFYRGTSHYPQSVAAFEQARRLSVELLGRDHSGHATILNNLAGTYRLMGEQEKAISLFRQAKELYEQLGEQESFPYASVLNNLALAYRETGDFARSIECLEQALERMETMPQLRQELAITRHNLAALYQKTENLALAKGHLERALELFEGCVEEENVHYAAALNSLAGILYQEGDYAGALERFEQSARYTLRFFGENVEYAIVWQNMSRVYEAMGHREECSRCLQRALAVYKKLFGQEDERCRAVAAQLKEVE